MSAPPNKTLKLINLEKKNPIAFKDTYELVVSTKYPNEKPIKQTLIVNKYDLMSIVNMINEELMN